MPRCFLKTSRFGTPFYGVVVSFCFGLLAFLSVSNGSAQAFIWLSNLSGKLLFVYPSFRKEKLSDSCICSP